MDYMDLSATGYRLKVHSAAGLSEQLRASNHTCANRRNELASKATLLFVPFATVFYYLLPPAFCFLIPQVTS